MAADYLDLALLLAAGKKVALGQVLLSHLYRGLFHFVESQFASFWGPIWFLQLLILAYFPDICLSAQFSPEDPLLGFALARTHFCRFRTTKIF